MIIIIMIMAMMHVMMILMMTKMNVRVNELTTSEEGASTNTDRHPNHKQARKGRKKKGERRQELLR